MTSTIDAADRACERISRRHGVSFYWASRLLAPDQRHHVHALYACCRRADDIVDSGLDTPTRRAGLDAFRTEFAAALDRGGADDPTLLAVARTIERYDIGRDLFDRFFDAMAADLDTTRYRTWDDLLCYMDGSAAVIGEMLLPILGPSDHVAAREPARALGLAFQLTNFLRDIDEDLDLGRQYLPQDELCAFSVDLRDRRVTPEFRELMRFQIARARGLYATADLGVAYLPPRSARCVRTAHRLYGRILDRIEHVGYDVFAGRVSVPATAKLGVVVRELVRRDPGVGLPDR